MKTKRTIKPERVCASFDEEWKVVERCVGQMVWAERSERGESEQGSFFGILLGVPPPLSQECSFSLGERKLGL